MSKESAIISKNWGTPEKVWQTTDILQRVETQRALDRSRVNALANGSRPYTPAEMKEFNHQLNVNWLELARKIQDATGQINNAFIPAGNFFTCHCEGGKEDMRPYWGQVFTKALNKVLKKGASGNRFHYVLRSRNSSVALHGIGPLMWTNDTRLIPRFVPLEDLLIPTDTQIDLTTNLFYFAVNLYLTPGELYRMACLGDKDSGWNKSAVARIIQDITTRAGKGFFPDDVQDWQYRPEAVVELWKQNSGYWESDAVPKARLRAFYYQNPDDQRWYRKIILIEPTANQPLEGKDAEFIYDKKTPFADNLAHIIHCQFGDNSLVPPLKYHSVRGIGTMLYAPCMTLNRFRSQAVQFGFSDLQTWWRVNDPNDRDRAKKILLMNNGIIDEGVSIIAANERHHADPRMIDFVISQMKQNVGENSTSYSPSPDTGTNKERTKFEVQAQLQSSTAMVGNVLSMMYAQEGFAYDEIKRRALIKTTDDPWAKQFQKECKDAGIPDDLMESSKWRVTADRVLGAGDNTLAQAQADALMSQRQSYDPESQKEILRLWTSTTLDDPDRAFALVPPTPAQGSSGTRAAEDVYGTLMQGVPVPMRKGIDHVGYCAALLKMMGMQIERIMTTDGVGTPQDLAGFSMVAQSIGENLQFIAQDPNNKQTVRQLGDLLGEMMNQVKAMGQRQQEAAQAAQQPQPDPAEIAKIQTDQMAAQQKMQSAEAQAAQKMQQREAEFEQRMMQRQREHAAKMEAAMAELQAKLGIQQAETDADLRAQGAETAADIKATGARTGAEVKAIESRVNAEVEATTRKADAQVKAQKKAAKEKPKPEA